MRLCKAYSNDGTLNVKKLLSKREDAFRKQQAAGEAGSDDELTPLEKEVLDKLPGLVAKLLSVIQEEEAYAA